MIAQFPQYLFHLILSPSYWIKYERLNSVQYTNQTVGAFAGPLPMHTQFFHISSNRHFRLNVNDVKIFQLFQTTKQYMRVTKRERAICHVKLCKAKLGISQYTAPSSHCSQIRPLEGRQSQLVSQS